MITNYIKIAWRNLLKNKIFSFINIAGLAIGLSCFTLIALYVTNELSYDKYNQKADQIYRVNTDIKFGGTDLHMAVSSDPMGETLKKDYPQVEQFTRIYASNGPKRIKKDNVYLEERNVVHVDSTFFDVFTLPAITGDTRHALVAPNTVVLTESAAKKYFGTVDALGKSIETNDNHNTPYKVTAVIKDVPQESHFHFNMFFSMANAEYGFGNFLSNNFQTYIVLKKGVDPDVFSQNFKTIIQKYVLVQAEQAMHINPADFEKSGNKIEYSLIPLTKIHLHSDYSVELDANGSIQYVYIFSAVAIFILLLACINFMNLSTARSAGRAKEVGIRKVLGTERSSLIRQFLTESILTSIIALVISLGITAICLPFFNSIAAKTLTFGSLFGTKYIFFLFLLPVVVGAIAGSYPAFFLSSFQPIKVLKGKLTGGTKRSYLRSGLVIFQFTTSIFLVIGTIVVFRQLHYIQTTKLGFDKEQVLIVNHMSALGAGENAFKNEVLAKKGVVNGTISSYLPVSESARTDNTFSKESVMTTRNGLNMQIWGVDNDYIPTLGMEIIKGRNFSKDFGTDSSALVINETTAGLLGYQDPIGQKIYYTRDNGSVREFNIIGVVRNFHFESLREGIGPLSLRLENKGEFASFKVSTTDMPALLASVESTWKNMVNDTPFDYRFLNTSFENMYRSEQRVGKVAISFAILAIIIACLGLFGLVTYMAEQRTKEIGVRKVLGASIPNIIAMLSADFIKLVVIAAVMAFPIAWWCMNRWLRDFAYRIHIGWWVFVAAGICALIIALLTVSLQAVRAAVANPVKSLRTE